jgi:hypothetical protein
MEKNLGWTKEQEQLLVSWAEKASGYTWLHNKSINYYKKRNMGIAVPASIFGYVAGTMTLISSDSFDNESVRSIIGVFGILAGILANLQQIFTFKELSEQHNISSLRFLSFFRDISCELSMHPKYRNNVIDYINLKRLELDKLLEQSPSIPEEIIQEFNKETTNINKLFHKPDITNILQTIEPYADNNDNNLKKINKRNLHKNDFKIMIKYFKIWKKNKEKIFKDNKSVNSTSNKIQIEIANSIKSNNTKNNSDTDNNTDNDTDNTYNDTNFKNIKYYDDNESIYKNKLFTLQNIKISKN